jgi:hypothetical protein
MAEARYTHEEMVNIMLTDPEVKKAYDEMEDEFSLLKSRLQAYYITENDFVENATIEHLETLSDLEAFERTKNDKIYNLEEVKRELWLEK